MSDRCPPRFRQPTHTAEPIFRPGAPIPDVSVSNKLAALRIVLKLIGSLLMALLLWVVIWGDAALNAPLSS